MAPRTFWKGYLKLSLVTCPVAMMPATSESEKVRFHTLNRKTGNRVLSRYVDSVSRKPVDEADEARGYQRGEEDYVILEDDELENVALETTRTIDIEMFVPSDEVGWIWYDKPALSLMPADKVSEEAFAVIREAMASRQTLGGIAQAGALPPRTFAVLLLNHATMVWWSGRCATAMKSAMPIDFFHQVIGDARLRPPDATHA